jgi:hypothetical protein
VATRHGRRPWTTPMLTDCAATGRQFSGGRLHGVPFRLSLHAVVTGQQRFCRGECVSLRCEAGPGHTSRSRGMGEALIRWLKLVAAPAGSEGETDAEVAVVSL